MPQSSSISLEKKLAEERRKSRVPAKVPLTEINEYLVCQLCFGYLIDATAIIECQHTFCKSCILNYLERKNNYCPICEVQLNEAKPHLSLRPDEILQKLVYKLVPGLVAAEVHRRKEHIAKSNSILPDGSLNGGTGGIALLSPDVKEAEDFCFLSPNDAVSLSLEYFKSTNVDEDSKSEQPSKPSTTTPAPTAAATTGITTASLTATETSPQKKNTCSDKANDRRYLQCPAAVSVGLLKKFIRMKYGLSDDYRVDLLYNGDRDNNMENDLTLLDLSFIFKWKKAEPMCFHYRIFDRPLLKSGSVRPGTKRSAPSIMDEPPDDDDAASGPTSRSSMMPTAPSKLPRFGDSGSGSSSNTTSSSTPKNNTGKGQGKKSNGTEDSTEATVGSTRGRRNSTDKESPKSAEVKESLSIKTEGTSTSQFNLRITTTTSPLGSSMTSKLSPSSSSSCSSSSSPPSPLKISLPLKAITEGKSHHHHRHHHRHHKDKKRHRSSKSKDKDRDREKGKDKGKDRERERYKYNAHPNPSQSQTISVKPGKHHNHGKRSPPTVTISSKNETAAGNTSNAKDKERGKDKDKIKGTTGSSSSSSSDVGSGTASPNNNKTIVNGGKNAAAAILGLTQRLSISGTSSPTTGNVKANNSISVSKVIERRNSTSSSHVLTLINANSGSKSGTVVSALPELQQRKPGRPSLASKVAAAAAAADQQGRASPTTRPGNNLHIPDSVHLQVPKSVTLIPVNPPGVGGSSNGKLLTTSRLSSNSERSGNSGRVGSSGPGNPHTFTHPITNKSLHQITVTEVPPPPSKSGGSNTEPNSSTGGFNGTGSSGNSGGSSGIKSIEKSIQSLSSRQFNGPGSMEITKIYCDNTKSSSTPSNCSTKVYEVQSGKKLKGLDISISPSPVGNSGGNSNAKSGSVGGRKDDSLSVTTQKLTVSLSKTLPKIPGVSILPQTSHLIGKQQSTPQQKIFGSSGGGGGHPTLMNSLSSKVNEKHSSNRLSITPQQPSAKNPLSLPGDNFSYRTSSSPSLEKALLNNSGRTPPRKQIGETTIVTRTPSPPRHHQHQSKPTTTFSSIAVKGKIKRPFESTFPRKNSTEGVERTSPDSGPSERKREKITPNPEHDSPLDLSGKSSRSTPSPAEGDIKGFSPTHSSSENPTNKGKGGGHTVPTGSSGQRQGHGSSNVSSKGHPSGNINNKSPSTAAHTQTILTIAQNLAQKHHQHNAEVQRHQQRALMRSKSMNGSSTGTGGGGKQAGSPPIGNSMVPVSGISDALGNLMTLSNAAARVGKMPGSAGAAATAHSINSLVAAASAVGFYPPVGQPSPPAPSTHNHLLSPHFGGPHHHMNMNLMSPPQLKPTLENTPTPSFFSNFTAGAAGRALAATTGANSLSPPLTNPFLPTMSAARSSSSSSSPTSLRIPNLTSKLSSVNKSPGGNSLLFPTLSLSSGNKNSGSGNPGTLSTKALGHSTVSVSPGLTRPTKINGTLLPSPNTFVAPSSIIPISKAQSQSVKNAIPNSMKISNFLPATKSTTVSANTNATITSGSSLNKFLNSIPPTPTMTPTIEISNNPSPKVSIPFSIDSIKSTTHSTTKPIIPSVQAMTTLTASTTLNSGKTSASTGYKLASTSSSEPSPSSDTATATSLGGKSGTNSGSGNGSGSTRGVGGRLGDLGIALGLVPREPPVQIQHTLTTQQGAAQAQQNQGVRHIPNPSQIFSSRQNNHSTSTSTSYANVTANNNTKTTTTKSDENGQVKLMPAVVVCGEKNTSSSFTATTASVVAAAADSLEVIKPGKPDPLALPLPLLPSPPLSSSSVEPPPMAMEMKKTENLVVKVLSHEDSHVTEREHQEKIEEKVQEPKKELEEEQRNDNVEVGEVLMPTPVPERMEVTEEIKSENNEKPGGNETLIEKVEINVSSTHDADPAGSGADSSAESHSGVEEKIGSEEIPLAVVVVSTPTDLEKVVIPPATADVPEEIQVAQAEVIQEEKKETDGGCLEIVESCVEKDTTESSSEEPCGESFSSEMNESESTTIISSTSDNNLRIDEECTGDMAEADDSQEEVTTEDDDEAETQVQLSLEMVVTQVENNKNALADEELLNPSSEIKSEEVEGLKIKTELLESESNQVSSVNLELAMAKNEGTSEPEVKQAIQKSSPINISTPSVPVTMTPATVENIQAVAPPPEILKPVQIKIEPVEPVNVPLIAIHLARQAERKSPVSVSPVGASKPKSPSSTSPEALTINTCSPVRAEPPRSLLIPSPTLVSVSSSGRSRSGSPSGLNSPGSDKKVDLRKMENLEKVAAGLLASAANNINNNNNMIVTTATTCDLSTLTSVPSNPSASVVANPAARATPPPITNV